MTRVKPQEHFNRLFPQLRSETYALDCAHVQSIGAHLCVVLEALRIVEIHADSLSVRMASVGKPKASRSDCDCQQRDCLPHHG